MAKSIENLPDSGNSRSSERDGLGFWLVSKPLSRKQKASSMINSAAATTEPKRIVCIDQLRGYAIFGMLLVNASGIFFEPIEASLEGSSIQGFFEACLYQLSHHRTTFTYADTIAPLFVFVVGMGMRLSWLRRTESAGASEVRRSLAKRYSVLVLIAFAVYAGWLWDALMDIGLAGLLALMLIDRKPRTRIIAAFAFVLAYQCIHMFTSYGTWSVHGTFSLDNPDYVPFLVRLVPLEDGTLQHQLERRSAGSNELGHDAPVWHLCIRRAG